MHPGILRFMWVSFRFDRNRARSHPGSGTCAISGLVRDVRSESRQKRKRETNGFSKTQQNPVLSSSKLWEYSMWEIVPYICWTFIAANFSPLTRNVLQCPTNLFKDQRTMKILHRNPKPMTKQTEMCVLLYLHPLKGVNVYYKILNDSVNIST